MQTSSKDYKDSKLPTGLVEPPLPFVWEDGGFCIFFEGVKSNVVDSY